MIGLLLPLHLNVPQTEPLGAICIDVRVSDSPSIAVRVPEDPEVAARVSDSPSVRVRVEVC